MKKSLLITELIGNKRKWEENKQMRFNIQIRWVALLMSLCFCAQIKADFGFTNQNKHVEVQLLSESRALVPGQTQWLGVRFDLMPDWHIYWRNCGDTGLPTKLTWEEQEGISFGETHWPVPQRFETSGLVSYGYHHQTLLLVPVRLDESKVWPEKVSLTLNVSWLECNKSCQPGRKKLALELSVLQESNGESFGEHRALFEQYRKLLPRKPMPKSLSAQKNAELITIAVKQVNAESKLTFFPEDNNDVIHSKAQSLEQAQSGLNLTVTAANAMLTQIKGVLRVEQGAVVEALDIDLPLGMKADSALSTSGQASAKLQHSFWGAILFAFIGGLFLNVMPCVLPVLSVKILQILSHANQNKRMILMNALSYAFGVVASFWLLAALLMTLRKAGQELGWGFQMQSPTMLMFLMAVFFIFGLNLFGVFEIGIGLVGVDQKVKKHSGLLGAFLSGILATVAATPCTAPYMGTALAFAITQPFFEAMAVFTGLGLGMASPFLLAGVFPNIMKLLPRPGAWMNTFKQFLGFLLMATVAYLFYVYTTVVEDQERIFWMGLCLVILSMAAWVWGKWAYVGGKTTWVARAFTLGLILVGLNIAGERIKLHQWEPYNQAALEVHLKAGVPVFLDFTASWCLSCKVNEKAVLETDRTATLFSKHKVIAMKADWSKYSPEITQALEALGRNSVPAYVLYDPKQPTQPLILPEVLTHGILEDAVSRLGK